MGDRTEKLTKRKRHGSTYPVNGRTSSLLKKVKGVKPPAADPKFEEKSEKLRNQKVLNGKVFDPDVSMMKCIEEIIEMMED